MAGNQQRQHLKQQEEKVTRRPAGVQYVLQMLAMVDEGCYLKVNTKQVGCPAIMAS